MKIWLRDKRRVLMIGFACVAALSVVGYAFAVDNFNDYDPPDTIYITWYDYFRDELTNSMSIGNAVTDWPRWSAAYPYRALLVGRGFGSGSSSSLSMQYAFMIYSKKPATDLFTFEYIEGDRKYPDSGRIRAKIRESDYIGSEDIAIRYSVVSGSAFDSVFEQVSFWNTLITTGNQDGYGNVVFEFDFYYECTASHESNTQLLNVSGLKSIPNVPYAYILKCNSHGSPGSSSSGSSSSGGSGGSGSNDKGDGDRHGWGGGEYGGGVDRETIDSNDMELSVPDDWREPVDDDYEGGFDSEYKPNYPAYVPAEGDTGEDGADWNLPSFDIENDGVSGEPDGYKSFPVDGEQGYLELIPDADGWGVVDLVPDAQYGLIDFMNP